MKKLLFLLLITVSSCSNAQDKTTFSDSALNEVMLDLEGQTLVFSEIIEKYSGKKIVIDVWASWCGDCVSGMPKVKSLQKEYDNTVFLFLSVDKSFETWKRGIEKYDVSGEHYFIPKGWKSDFNKSIDLDWIPRYMVVAPTGKIELFKATDASSKKLEKAIKK